MIEDIDLGIAVDVLNSEDVDEIFDVLLRSSTLSPLPFPSSTSRAPTTLISRICD